MRILRACVLLCFAVVGTAFSPPESPQQALNQYVAFLNQAVDEFINRFQRLQAYQADVTRYRKKADSRLQLASSGPLEDYYYRQARAGKGLTSAETQRLTAGAEALWQLLTRLDQTGKALETYIRLQEYQRDTLHRSDALVGEMQALISQFSREKETFYAQIQPIYRRYQPYAAADAYLATENEMAQVLLSQQALLRALPYYLDEDSPADWPLSLVEQSMLVDEKFLAEFGKARLKIQYPASDAVSGFKTALHSIQTLKRRAIDDHTFAARQSARHGNAVYLSLLQHYNQDLLANHQAFVNDSRPVKALLASPKFSPVFTLEPSAPLAQTAARTVPFQDQPPPPFGTKPATAPASKATFLALNGYVDFINESLRQMHQFQVLVRNYQSSAEQYRDPSRSRQRANLTYSHEAVKVPVAGFHLLRSASPHIPAPYRSSLNAQADVLLEMLKEMDALSIELIAYTTEKQYLADQLQRSDEILDRYAVLFDTFDPKKEQLYRDVRRVHESYPVANPTSSWNRAGKALLKTLDDDKALLFGVKAFLKKETTQLPPTSQVETGARDLMRAEYQNLKGLPRLGRSNGLCPYSPYEDVAENSLRLTQMPQKLTRTNSTSTSHPYEAFYYFYNNELVYQYNKFSELAKADLLKAVDQPDFFAFRRLPPSGLPAPAHVERASNGAVVAPRPEGVRAGEVKPGGQANPSVVDRIEQRLRQRDTVYVERFRVDTVYVDRTASREAIPSLAGFAANNLILLLDVSASMDSPLKLPLLKRSIKSLLTLLRPEDQISVVVYSGKARMALKPTSGDRAEEIARVIDGLRSDGDTDGDAGIRLAYKVANKNYLRAGNNRIVLATDGEFPVGDKVLQLIGESARQDVYLTVFTFGKNPLKGKSLKNLSELGKGTYAHVTAENANLQLILEAQAKQRPLK